MCPFLALVFFSVLPTLTILSPLLSTHHFSLLPYPLPSYDCLFSFFCLACPHLCCPNASFPTHPLTPLGLPFSPHRLFICPTPHPKPYTAQTHGGCTQRRSHDRHVMWWMSIVPVSDTREHSRWWHGDAPDWTPPISGKGSWWYHRYIVFVLEVILQSYWSYMMPEKHRTTWEWCCVLIVSLTKWPWGCLEFIYQWEPLWVNSTQMERQ